MTVQDYLDLVTSEYQNQPNFNAMLSFMVAVPVQVQNLMTQMQGTLFNLSTPAVGNQLDIIGQWVGISRDVNIPATGIYFSWDDAVDNNGWDEGSWAPLSQPPVIVSLPDDAYLTLIYAKIAANSWDGTTNGAYAIWNTLFAPDTILIIDHQDMTYDLGIYSPTGHVSALTLALFVNGYIQLRPEGVEILNYFTNVDTNPMFGWDTENTLMGGWNQGSWVEYVT